LIFENKGNVHLAPYGIIEVFNFWGKKISEIEVAPWFVLPNSLKLKEINWKENRILVGKYKAVATIDRGYKGILDKKEVEFWVLPLKTFGIWFGCALLIILLGKWFLSHYEIRKKV
ncbi:hypothetical protein H5T58_03415, partial [Candidatus Parcubacteria bacterium]|nr:hypothetical protein [Candidatus Parcubacteria bacterium]